MRLAQTPSLLIQSDSDEVLGPHIIEDETAFITWSAETADNVYDLGTDTFWIHDGKILVQTYAGKATPKS